jgi:head-tail adaptor
MPLSGVEVFQASHLGHQVSHRIQMRFNKNIDTKKRLRHYDLALEKWREFKIVYALDTQNRHTQWEIFAHEEL